MSLFQLAKRLDVVRYEISDVIDNCKESQGKWLSAATLNFLFSSDFIIFISPYFQGVKLSYCRWCPYPDDSSLLSHPPQSGRLKLDRRSSITKIKHWKIFDNIS